MYAEFYGLRESPFALTPDPSYLFLSEPHKEALASAVYGVQERKGFVLILGEVGTGKTTLIRHLLGRFGPNIHSVFVFNPAVSFTELLQLILRDLELPCASLRRIEMIDTLNDYLLKEAAAGRYVVVIIDEAQHLSPSVLEEVRMLSNLETARGKLIQILLVGQPELGDKLSRPELRQLRQRISLVAELKPLTASDTAQYIRHRLEVAGLSDPRLFTDRALRLIYRASGGIPRLVNVICDKALVLSYGAGEKQVKGGVIKEVLKDWRPFQRSASASPSLRARARSSRHGARSHPPLGKIAAAVAIGIVGIALLVVVIGQRERDFLGRIWHGLLPSGAAGTVVRSTEIHDPPPHVPGATPSSEGSATTPQLPPRPDLRSVGPRLNEPAPPIPPDSTPKASAPPGPPVESPKAATTPPTGAQPRAAVVRERPREIVVAPGQVFSELVTRNYGRADLTLLDFVKAANPAVSSIDVVLTGQRLKLPAFEPEALVQKTNDARYRVHLVTIWDNQSQDLPRLRSMVAQLGRQTYVIPVTLTQRETAQRVVIGDFSNRETAEAFYRDFRVPTALSGQLWR